MALKAFWVSRGIFSWYYLLLRLCGQTVTAVKLSSIKKVALG